ncbi:MAG: TAXI family TRAP transporter solute-binding subunit [Alphaproteobacteria bacterium]|nr:TAXI family TRAP transporter solute-binding subunit [Alphaproteobacteria bacterium]
MRAGLFAAVAAGALAAQPAQAQQFINILTGGTSGVYYPMGVALAKIYTDKVQGVRPSVQATKASVENINLLQAGRGEVALVLGDSLRDAWAGSTEAGFKSKMDRMRGIAAFYPNYIQIVALRSSGIRTLADLKGKRLSVGAARSGTELNARAVFAAAGMSYKDLSKTEYLPFGESVELMKNRQLDATLQSAGLGVASIRDLANSVEINVVEVPADLVQKIGPPFVAATIPANTYKGQEQAAATAAVVNFLITRSTLSEEIVYNLTKAMWENVGELAAAHSAGRLVKLENALAGMSVPLHPGAERYYKEKGLIK